MGYQDDIRSSVISHSLEEISRYTYSFITLAVAAIGYSVSLSIDLAVSWSLLPLFLAVFLWGISLIYAFLSMENKFKMFTALNAMMQAKDDIDIAANLVIEDALEKKKNKERLLLLAVMIDSKKKELNKASDETERLTVRNKNFFLLGILAFIIWWVIKLVNNTAVIS
ncbi:MAG: hypothetical protein EOO46_01350 [Flavobacterium sp.]|nr:MAG: hypothetical protein EOO46_01350 [Flavobacterium sp.]